MSDRLDPDSDYAYDATNQRVISRNRVPRRCPNCKGKGWLTSSIKMYPGDRVACSRCVNRQLSYAGRAPYIDADGKGYDHKRRDA